MLYGQHRNGESQVIESPAPRRKNKSVVSEERAGLVNSNFRAPELTSLAGPLQNKCKGAPGGGVLQPPGPPFSLQLLLEEQFVSATL